ncbi:crossover junction endodeoxyribonuclease RuvC [Candidatus Woesebacteria bacterium]|nr:crossover junction endodeoxyribonuclease RuvC [Candidatus Woesebacteria bacterium]
MKKIILGIDPGYDRVGWAIGSGEKGKFNCVALGCIQTDKTADIFDRYKRIQSDLKEIIEYFKPSELAIETLFFSKNKKTALRVSEARGVIIAACLDAGLAVFEYDPVTIKVAVTGNGKADKESVEKMVKLQVNGVVNKFIDDAIDAVAIAMTHGVSVNI